MFVHTRELIFPSAKESSVFLWHT